MKIGTTSSGKEIYSNPKHNLDFAKEDHMDAYRAHAKALMSKHIDNKGHREAMNAHYMEAMKLDDQQSLQ